MNISIAIAIVVLVAIWLIIGYSMITAPIDPNDEFDESEIYK